MSEPFEFHAEARPYMDHVAVYMRQGQYHGENIKMERREEGMVMSPLVTLTRAEAQGLANTLWDAGIRPHQAGDRYGIDKATGEHLEDMRQIAFGFLKTQGILPLGDI